MADVKDPRSTYRKRARRVLESIDRPKWCGSTQAGEVSEWGCGRSNVDPDAPGGYYPNMGTLQCNHINKVLADLDPVNLEYLCPSCHKERDQLTDKGVSIIEDEFGYGLDLLS